jgi:hypothetical protein
MDLRIYQILQGITDGSTSNGDLRIEDQGKTFASTSGASDVQKRAYPGRAKTAA